MDTRVADSSGAMGGEHGSILGFNTRTLRLAGWPGPGVSPARGRLLVKGHILLVTVLAATAFHDLARAFRRGQLNAIGICTFNLSVDALTFLATFLLNYEGFLELVRHLRQEVVGRRRAGVQQQLVDRAERDGGRFSRLWFGMVVSHGVIELASAAAGGVLALQRRGNMTAVELPLPGGFRYSWETQRALAPYLLLFSLLACAGASLHVSFATVEPLCVAAILHLNAQLRILQDSLAGLRRGAQAVVSRASPPGDDDTAAGARQAELEREMTSSLHDCIRHHNQILASAATLSSVYSAMMVVLVLVDVGNLTILTFELTKASGDSATKLIHVQTLLCALLHSCFYCFMSEQMAQQSQLVGQSAYSCNWLDAPLTFKRSLSMIVMRAQRPVVLTMGKFNRLTMQTFLWTLRVAYSYSAVLHQFYSRE